MLPIKIIKHKNATPVNDIGDILFPFDTWENTSTAGGWCSKIPPEFYETKPYYPLCVVNANPWKALSDLGVSCNEFKKSVEYTCPYNGYVHYWCLPILVFTSDVKNWTARYKIFKEEMYLDREWMKNFYPPKVKNALPFSKVQRSLLGPGYTDMTLPIDGSGYLYDTILALDNEDYLGAKVWMWFNK